MTDAARTAKHSSDETRVRADPQACDQTFPMSKPRNSDMSDTHEEGDRREAMRRLGAAGIGGAFGLPILVH